MNHARLHSTKTKIAQQLGYFPAFLIPAIDSSLIFRSLVQQTLSAYVNNPLPQLFKEKLFVYLSRYFNLNYFTICHSCTLKSLGMNAVEILRLEKIDYPPIEQDTLADLQLLRDRWSDRRDWHHNSQLETSLLRCSYFIFRQSSGATNCAIALQELLGTVYYNYLIVLLGYIKLCHQWVSAHPEISHQEDRRSQLYLGSLLLEDIRLAKFFQGNVNSESKPQKIPSTSSQTIDAPKINSSQVTKQNLVKGSLPEDRQLKQVTAKGGAEGTPTATLLPGVTLTTCLANAPFPIMIHNHQDDVLYLNRNWIELTGYNTNDISTIEDWKQKARVQPRETFQFFPSTTNKAKHNNILRSPKVGTQTHNMLQEIADSLSSLAEELNEIEIEKPGVRGVKSEVTIVTSKGERRFWESYCTPFSLGKGKELKISIIKDITEVIRSKTQLLEIEDRLKLLQDAAEIGTFTWKIVDNKIDFCHRSLTILGLNDFDGSYKSFLELIHPDARESIDLAIVKAIQSDRELEIECPIIKPNRSVNWIRMQGKVRYNSNRKPIRLTGILMNVTPEQVASSAVDSHYPRIQPSVSPSLTELAKIVDILPVYIWVIEIKTKTVSFINKKLSQNLVLGDRAQANEPSNPHQLKLGGKIEEYFTPDRTRQIIWQQQQALTYLEELHIQEEVTLADGVHNFDTTITPLRNDSGEIYALLYTHKDIPDLTATREALSQRTLQLEAANQELESFSFSVSHDLQAPLRVINGFSQVLWENYQPHLDDRGKHYLQRIQANSEKMSDLIDALLQLSRVTRSQMKSMMVDLSQIASDIVEELRARDPERQVKVTITPNLQAKGDPQLLRIVLNNLLDNAWKYTSKRSQAEIELDVISVAENQLAYFVRDNGAGFDLEYADKLFTPFKRLHTQKEFPGTGIGLATVQRIIYRHGGKVWAESQCDRGATIYFSLP